MDGIRDIRRFRRLAAGVAMIAAAPVIFASVAIKPQADEGSSSDLLAAVAANAAAWEASLVLALVAIVLLIPATLGLMRVAQMGSTLLALIGGSLALVGWVAFMGQEAVGAVILAMAHATGDRAAMVALNDQLGNSNTLTAILVVFILGHVVGITVLGIALARSRVSPAWIGIVLAVSGPLHFVANASGIRPLDLGAFFLLVLGYGATGVIVLRLADQRWEVAPPPSVRTPAPVPAPAIP